MGPSSTGRLAGKLAQDHELKEQTHALTLLWHLGRGGAAARDWRGVSSIPDAAEVKGLDAAEVKEVPSDAAAALAPSSTSVPGADARDAATRRSDRSGKDSAVAARGDSFVSRGAGRVLVEAVGARRAVGVYAARCSRRGRAHPGCRRGPDQVERERGEEFPTAVRDPEAKLDGRRRRRRVGHQADREALDPLNKLAAGEHVLGPGPGRISPAGTVREPTEEGAIAAWVADVEAEDIWHELVA